MKLGALEPQIIRRKTIKAFNDQPVSDQLIEELCDFLSEQEMPKDGIDWNFDTLPYMDMVRIAAVEPAVKAPYFLVLRAERKNFSLQNSGYLGELAVLWLTERGLATCWQGNISVGDDFPDCLPYVAAIGFGYSDEPFRRSAEEFQRQPLKKMIFGEFDGVRHDIAEAVRLAPSSMNRQPVSLLSANGRIHVFRNHVFLKNPVVSYAQCLDTGAAMAHIHVKGDALGCDVRFVGVDPDPTWGNRIYQVSVTL